MPANEHIKFPCLEVVQPIGIFYIGTMNSRDVVAISYADIRQINKRRDIEIVSGIQRELSATRVRELKQYVRTIDASFPTSIILAIKSSAASYDGNSRTMTVESKENTALIIDGQHRIKGFEDYAGPNFELNVTLFVDMDPEDQALVFATINLKQTKVSKSLAYDLFEFAKDRSPQKTCHNIARLLNSEEGSPFKDRIKILGVATGKPHETLTQATFIDRLIHYISDNPLQDRDTIQRRGKLMHAEGPNIRRLIFRNMFIDNQDAEIARIIFNYFQAVSLRWPEAWPIKKEGNVLNRTTGFGALMRFLRPAYLKIATPGKIESHGAVVIWSRASDSMLPQLG